MKKMCDKVCRHPLHFSSWMVCDGKLYKHGSDYFSNFPDNWKLVLPKYKKPELIKKCYDNPLSGDFGIYKTYHRVVLRHYWSGSLDINKYVKRCGICASNKPKQLKKAGEMGSKLIY